MNHNEVPETELTNPDMIRNAIAKNPSVTQKELQELTGLSRSGVRYILQQMRIRRISEVTGKPLSSSMEMLHCAVPFLICLLA